MRMDMDRAIASIGINTTKHFLKNMVCALGMMSWLNTTEENERRVAGQFLLKRWSAYQAECNARRNRR